MVNDNDTITLPRNVVEQALDAFETDGWQKKLQAAIALRAALHQPQDHIPDTEQSSAVQQPQGEQEPFAWISPRTLEWGTRQSEKVVKLTCKAQPEYDFTEPLYTHPQPKREPGCEDEGCPHHGTAHVYIN